MTEYRRAHGGIGAGKHLLSHWRGLLLASLLILLLIMGSEKTVHAAFPGENGKIAFDTNRDGNWEIYSMNADGTAKTNLTNSPPDANLGGASGFDRYPDWSPDGKRIAFQSYRDGDYEIYVMNADGTAQTNLTNATTWDMNPAWSPDGTKIAFRSDLGSSNWDVWVMSVDGTIKTKLTNEAYVMDLAWSPDGTKITYTSYQGNGNYEIYVVNADGTGMTRLTDDPAEDRNPDWSPDGSKLAFESNRDGTYKVWSMEANGSGQIPINTPPGGGSFVSPAWSPDGTRIVYAGSFGISVMEPDGTDIQQGLTDSAAQNDAPSWQPLPATDPPPPQRTPPLRTLLLPPASPAPSRPPLPASPSPLLRTGPPSGAASMVPSSAPARHRRSSLT